MKGLAFEFIADELHDLFGEACMVTLLRPTMETVAHDWENHVELRLTLHLPGEGYHDIQRHCWAMRVELSDVMFDDVALEWRWRDWHNRYFIRSQIRTGIQSMERSALRQVEKASERY